MRLKLTLLLSFALFLVACSEVILAEKNELQLAGYVLNSPAGSGISTKIQFVSKSGQTYEATSSDDGSYEIKLNKGIYSALVTAKGLASTRVEGLNLAQSKNQYDFVVFPVFNPSWSTVPPKISLDGPSTAKTYDGKIPFRLETQTSAPLRAIYVAVGHTPGKGLLSGSQLEFFATKDTDWRSIDLSNSVTGKTTFEVVAYDQNNNRTHIIVPISIKGTNIPKLSLEPIEDLRAVAITFNRNLDTLAVSAETAHSIINQVQWSEYNWPEDAVGRVHGFRIWQKIAGESKLLGIAAANKTSFFDRTASLKVGQEVEYSIAAFIADQEAEKRTDSVIPLAPFKVELVSPADNTTVGAYPKFAWRAVPEVGEEQIYYPLFWNNITGKEVSKIAQFAFTRENEIEFKDTALKPLWPGRSYGWELLIAYAVDDAENPKAYSVAVDRDGALGGVYIPGPFSVFEVE